MQSPTEPYARDIRIASTVIVVSIYATKSIVCSQHAVIYCTQLARLASTVIVVSIYVTTCSLLHAAACCNLLYAASTPSLHRHCC